MNVTFATVVRLAASSSWPWSCSSSPSSAQVTLFDANADLLPLVALSIGLLAGPVAGATVGFLLGLVADMALLQTLGVTSLLLIGVGYLAGRYRELRDATHKLVPPIGGLVATLAYAAAFSLVQFLLGVESPVSPLVIREIAGRRAPERAADHSRVRGGTCVPAGGPDRRPAPAPPAGDPPEGART